MLIELTLELMHQYYFFGESFFIHYNSIQLEILVSVVACIGDSVYITLFFIHYNSIRLETDGKITLFFFIIALTIEAYTRATK
jgi:hypothetical protein